MLDKLSKMRVENMCSSSGKSVPNQYEITTNDGLFFQSYISLICFIDNVGIIFLDENKWNYSVTTSKYRNKFLGTFGDFGTFSFFYSHQITSGEGGMIVCNNDKDYEILFALRSHGWLGGTRFYTRRLRSYNYYAKKYPSLEKKLTIFHTENYAVSYTHLTLPTIYSV